MNIETLEINNRKEQFLKFTNSKLIEIELIEILEFVTITLRH